MYDVFVFNRAFHFSLYCRSSDSTLLRKACNIINTDRTFPWVHPGGSVSRSPQVCLPLPNTAIKWAAPTFVANQHSPLSQYLFHKKLENVSCEYDRLNGWNSTLQAAWYIRHVRWTCLFYISFIILVWFLWTKPTIWLLILSFTKKSFARVLCLNPYEGYRSVTPPLDAARANRTIFGNHSVPILKCIYPNKFKCRQSSTYNIYTHGAQLSWQPVQLCDPRTTAAHSDQQDKISKNRNNS